MFCSQCGQRNPDQARFCTQCGSALQAGAPAQPAWGGRPPTPTPPEPGLGPPPPTSPYGPPPPQGGYAPAYGPPQPPPAYGAPGYGPSAPTYGQASFYATARAMEYKGVMPRFLASIIDGILIGIGMSVVMAVLGGGLSADALASGEVAYALAGTPALLILALGWGYPILFEGLFGGTIGKLMLGMRVVNAQGETAGLGRSLVRNLLRLVDALPFMYLLGVILVASSDTKQRLGDRVAGTYVVAR